MFHCIASLWLLAVTSSVSSAVPTVATPPPARALNPAKTQSIMQAIFAPMTTLLGYSMSKSTFRDANHTGAINDAFAALVQNAGRLEQHGRQRDLGFAFVAASLGRDARAAQAQFANAYYDEARYTLRHMTDNCLSCHDSLPAAQSFPGAARFYASTTINALSADEKAYFYVVTRRFDEALTAYEAYFRASKLDLGTLTMLGSFTEYLKVNVSVRSDLKRPQALLTELAGRPDTLPHVRQRLQTWVKALQDLDRSHALQPATPAAASRLLDQGSALMDTHADRDGLVHYLAAEALLNRFIHSHPTDDSAAGEAYYLLGTIAELTEYSLWIRRSAFYLEQAVRLAPGASYAPKAYGMLAQNLAEEFSTGNGAPLPPEEAERLRSLQRLINQAHEKSRP